jgi:hypothetical protein
MYDIHQRCTNLTKATKFCIAASNICVYSVLDLRHVTLMASRILRWVLDFWNICGLLIYNIRKTRKRQHPQSLP